MPRSDAPAVYRVGGASVTKIPEITAAFPAGKLLPDYDSARLPPSPDGVPPGDRADGQLALSVHSWLVRVGAMTVLIDTGTAIIC